MVALEEAMKKHHISLDSSSESTSHGHALCASGYSYTTSSSSTSIEWEWIIDFGASYHMAKDKAIFSTMHECNTKQIFVGDDISLRLVGSEYKMVILVMYYVFQEFPAICCLSMKSLILVKEKL